MWHGTHHFGKAGLYGKLGNGDTKRFCEVTVIIECTQRVEQLQSVGHVHRGWCREEIEVDDIIDAQRFQLQYHLGEVTSLHLRCLLRLHDAVMLSKGSASARETEG